MKSAIIAAIVAAIISATAATAASTGLITGAQIKNGSVGLVDLSGKAKQSLRGQRGPAGPAGLAGPQGIAGGFDPAKVSYVTGPTSTFAPGDIGSVQATCPSNTKVLGGGYFANITHVAGSQTFNGQSWNVIILNDTSISVDANAFAVCGAR